MRQNVFNHSLFGSYQDFILPLVFEKGDDIAVYGTAFIIAPRVALTAFHVLEDYHKHFNLGPIEDGRKIDDILVYLLDADVRDPKLEEAMVLPGNARHYNISEISRIGDSDIALLILSTEKPTPNYPLLDITPQKEGAELYAIGYTDFETGVFYENGERFINLGLNPRLSDGVNIKTYPERMTQWSAHPYPAYEVFMGFEGGMSGGPVINKTTGRVVGMVISSINTPDEFGNYHSIAASLASIALLDFSSGDRKSSFLEYMKYIGLGVLGDDLYGRSSDNTGVELL